MRFAFGQTASQKLFSTSAQVAHNDAQVIDVASYCEPRLPSRSVNRKQQHRHIEWVSWRASNLLLLLPVMESRPLFRDTDIWRNTGVKTRDEPRH